MDPQDKTQLEWKYYLNKKRLTTEERALFILAMNDFSIGQIAKLVHIEAPIVLDRLRKAVNKLWRK